MGGMDHFRRSGKGLLFFDNGCCAITTSNHDLFTDHNIFLKDRCLTSVLIKKDKSKSVCFRTGPYLLYLRYNTKDRIEGTGYFIHYRVKKVYKLKFGDRGSLEIKQRILEPMILKTIFADDCLQDLI